ncbi:MAG: signal transduction histidine kinase [Proteobacteria bacterium]|nr:signal transduction histidine kinase [Pseudomonadota bacterium]
MSIRLKAILLFFLVTAVIASTALGFSYTLLQDSLAAEIRGRLRNIAHIGGASVDVVTVERLIGRLKEKLTEERVAEIERSADYLRIYRQFQAIRQAEPSLIQFVYILVPSQKPGEAFFLVDADVLDAVARQAAGQVLNEEISHFGLSYDINHRPFIKKAFSSEAVVIEDAFTPDPKYNTNSLSAYAPIRSADGRLLGILGVDLKDENMRKALNKSALGSSLIVFFSVLAALVISVVFGDRLTQGIRALDGVVREFALKRFDVRASVKSRDEIGHLSASFNNMAQTIDNDARHLQALLAAYGKFVPHTFLAFLQKASIIDLALGDHVQQEMTVLFSDIRSFTSLSETMTPKQNFDFINAFLRRVGPVIRDHGGVIDKYIGDAVMALFPGSVERAVRAAIDMQRRVAAYNFERQAKGYMPIAIGVGLHWGNLILGTVGEDERMDSTVISDAVNLASRLEGVTKNYGASIVVSEAIISRLPSSADFDVRFLDKIQVKGKKEPVVIYEIFDADPEAVRQCKRDLAEKWQSAVDAYYRRDFAGAGSLFREIHARLPNDLPAAIYLERATLAENEGVAEDWKGIEVLQSK